MMIAYYISSIFTVKENLNFKFVLIPYLVALINILFENCYHDLNSFYSSSSEKENPTIHIFDGRGSHESIHKMEKLHTKPVTLIKVSVFEKLFTKTGFHLVIICIVVLLYTPSDPLYLQGFISFFLIYYARLIWYIRERKNVYDTCVIRF